MYGDYEQEQRKRAAEFTVRDSGKQAEYASGMRRDTTEGKPKFNLMLPEGVPLEDQLLYRVAMHYARGGEKYGDRNWEKSSAPEDLGHHIEALWRHFMKFVLDVQDGEDHAAAIVWNVNAVLLTRRNIKALDKMLGRETAEHSAELDRQQDDAPCVPVTETELEGEIARFWRERRHEQERRPDGP